jgi:secondary thiamine-phosphate synthase enzyme
MSDPLPPIISVAPETIATATLVVETGGQAFTDITREAMRFIKQTGAKDGALFIFMRHTSASLVIQENADPDVRTDLVSALDRLAPADGHWVHDVEGPDDMPAHVKTMLTGVSLYVHRDRRGARARRLAGHLHRRAPRPAAPTRNRAAIHREQAVIPVVCSQERRSKLADGRP